MQLNTLKTIMKNPQVKKQSIVKNRKFPPRIRNDSGFHDIYLTAHEASSKINQEKQKRQSNWKEVKLCLFSFDMVLNKENYKDPTELCQS